MYVNGEYRDDSDIGKLMHDFCCWDPNQMILSEFKSISKYFKETQEGVTTMCKAFEELRDEGRRDNAIDVAKRMLEKGKYTIEEIIEISGLPLDQIKELAGA